MSLTGTNGVDLQWLQWYMTLIVKENSMEEIDMFDGYCNNNVPVFSKRINDDV